MMDIIVELRFGSHLYGTATAQSDIDYKAVYIPSARDILLQRVRAAISRPSDKAPGEKNAPGAVDQVSERSEVVAQADSLLVSVLTDAFRT
jgi:predicted nucleotidyltransferase